MSGKRAIDDEMHEDEMRPVTLPSGALFHVHHLEQDYFTERVKKYLEHNHFTNISDTQDLDRVMIGEMLIYRWGQWIMQGKNYWGEAVDDSALQKSIKELSGELRQVKSALSLDKVSRDRQRGEDSVAAYLANLRTRAQHFGIKRNSEFNKALELFHQLKSLVTLHDNCDEQERRERKVEMVHIFAWMRDVAFPEFDELDRKFRQDGPDAQKLWIQEQ